MHSKAFTEQCFSSFSYITLILTSQSHIFVCNLSCPSIGIFLFPPSPVLSWPKAKTLFFCHSCKVHDAAVKFWIIIFQTVVPLKLQQAPCPGALLDIMTNC